MASQLGILAEVPSAARFITWRLKPSRDPREALTKLARLESLSSMVVGVGRELTVRLGVEIEGLADHPSDLGGTRGVPSTPAALWTWIRGTDRGALLPITRRLREVLGAAFEIVSITEAFKHGEGRDLSGYVDGTENPVDDAAVEAAIVAGRGAGLDGGSFVAVQRWVHDWDAFDAMSEHHSDMVIGRRLSDDEEIEEAPESAHVKRTEQESFTPNAFVTRRSMPWSNATDSGLIFVAFGRSTAAYEVMLGRMLGAEDGITDALFEFTQPETGAYYFCPPSNPDGTLDLSALALS